MPQYAQHRVSVVRFLREPGQCAGERATKPRTTEPVSSARMTARGPETTPLTRHMRLRSRERARAAYSAYALSKFSGVTGLMNKGSQRHQHISTDQAVESQPHIFSFPVLLSVPKATLPRDAQNLPTGCMPVPRGAAFDDVRATPASPLQCDVSTQALPAAASPQT